MVSKETDSEHVIDSLKTGYSPPEDRPFEDMEIEQQAQKTKRKTLGGFGLFTKAPEKVPQEDMSHLPPQQRKRQLQKMKKEVEKDIDKDQKEIAALQKVFSDINSDLIKFFSVIFENLGEKQMFIWDEIFWDPKSPVPIPGIGNGDSSFWTSSKNALGWDFYP